MHLDVTSLMFWKTEHTKEDNEDASSADEVRGLFTVVDGVGEASFSYQWAPVLARHFVDGPLFTTDPFEVEHWVRAAQEVGQQKITPAESLEGIAKTKARLGAAATLLGLGILPRNDPSGSSSPTYKVTAVGDSNFFHWRRDSEAAYSLLRAFPLQDSMAFGTLPDSINSRTFDRDSTKVQLLDASTDPNNDLRDGDVLLLATDAVAQWILRTMEAGGNPMTGLLQQTEDSWPDFVLGLRQEKKIVNDDSTLLLISVISTAEGNPLAEFPDQMAKRTDELWALIRRYTEGQARDIELALAYGDGSHIAAGTCAFVEPLVVQWRVRADAYKSVSDAINVYLRHPEQKAQLVRIWERVRDILLELHWTQELISTLRTMGVETEQAPNIANSLASIPGNTPGNDLLTIQKVDEMSVEPAAEVAREAKGALNVPAATQEVNVALENTYQPVAPVLGAADSMVTNVPTAQLDGGGLQISDLATPVHGPADDPMPVDSRPQDSLQTDGALQSNVREHTQTRGTFKGLGRAISRLVLGDDTE